MTENEENGLIGDIIKNIAGNTGLMDALRDSLGVESAEDRNAQYEKILERIEGNQHKTIDFLNVLKNRIISIENKVGEILQNATN